MAELQTTGDMDTFRQQADTIIGAYQEIGLANPRTHDVLVDKTASELAKLAALAGDLEYEPYVVPSAITPTLDFWQLLGQYQPSLARKVQSGKGGFVFRDLWDQYLNGELSLPPSARPFVSGMLLGGPNESNPGLHANGATGSRRQHAINSVKVNLQPRQREGLHIEPLEPAAWIALNAIHRHRHEPLLGGFTHFDLPAKEAHPRSANRTLVEPYATINREGILLGGSKIEGLISRVDSNGRSYSSPHGLWESGIRLAVSQRLSYESVPAELPETEGELTADVRIDELTHQAI